MLKKIKNYFKNRNNPEIEKPGVEVEIELTTTGLVIFAIIVFLIFKFV